MVPYRAAGRAARRRFEVAAVSVLARPASGDAARTYPHPAAPSVLLLALEVLLVLCLPALLSRRLRPWAVGYLLGTMAIPVLLLLGWVVIAALLSMG